MSNVPTRKESGKFKLTRDIADTHRHIDGTVNQDDCLNFLPATSSIFTPIPAVVRTNASITTSKNLPITSSASVKREVTRSPAVFSQSPTLEQPCPHAGNDFAIPTTLQIDIQPLKAENAHIRGKQSPRDNVTEIVDFEPEIIGEHFLLARLKRSYDLTHQHREKHNRSSRHISQTHKQIKTLQNEKSQKIRMQNVRKALRENAKSFIRNNTDLLLGSKQHLSSGRHFSLRTLYKTLL